VIEKARAIGVLGLGTLDILGLVNDEHAKVELRVLLQVRASEKRLVAPNERVCIGEEGQRKYERNEELLTRCEDGRKSGVVASSCQSLHLGAQGLPLGRVALVDHDGHGRGEPAEFELPVAQDGLGADDEVERVYTLLTKVGEEGDGLDRLARSLRNQRVSSIHIEGVESQPAAPAQ
jgi:hypothetical protein